jgi:hypothetical protein
MPATSWPSPTPTTSRPASIPVTSISGAGGFDAYASLLKGSKPGGIDAETRPLAKGEFAMLLAKQQGEKRVQLAAAAEMFKQLAEELPHVRLVKGEDEAAVAAHTKAEIVKAARAILVAMRRDEVGPPLVESIKLQLYNACLLSDNYEKAIGLYPVLKTWVGERMRGIYTLGDSKDGILRRRSIENYFAKTPNARDGLLAVFTEKSMTSDKPVQPQAVIYHFGSMLPLYYILANCSDLPQGTCGDCSGDTEGRLKKILGGNFAAIKPGFIGRFCEFAAKFA